MLSVPSLSLCLGGQSKIGEAKWDARRVVVDCFKAHVNRDGKTRSMEGEEVAC